MSSVKRENNTVVLSGTTLILDIEGTTSSISFVKDDLFPYVQTHLDDYVKTKWESAELQEIIKALKTQAEEDEKKKMEGVVLILENGEQDDLVKTVINNVLWQMKNDRKTKCLKDLQGLIMENGYKEGDLKGHVYDDVEPNLKSWTELNKSIYIYSSGSVHAQKLLFGHSVKGDLLPFIKGHFDTTVGMKGEAESYRKILEEISCTPSDAAFLTDVPKEARAAKEAGIKSILLSREGNAPLTKEDIEEFPVITSFEEIEFEHNSKKRKICTEALVTNDNKSIETCVVSVDEKLDPNDPKLTTNGDVEKMEVEESTGEETDIKEDMHESKNEANSGVDDMQENNCDMPLKLKENKEEIVDNSSDVKMESTCEKEEVEPVCEDKADTISGEQIHCVWNEKGENSVQNDLASADKGPDGKKEKDEENNKINVASVPVEEENTPETINEKNKETGVQETEINQTNGVSSVAEEKTTDATANGIEETDVKMSNANRETNELPSVVETEFKSIGADSKPNQSNSQKIEKIEEETVEKETVSIEEVKNVVCDNSTLTSSHKIKEKESEEKQTDITESKIDSTVDSTQSDSTKSITPFSKSPKSFVENSTSEAEIKGDVNTNPRDTDVKENGCVDSSELKDTKSPPEMANPSENKSGEKISIPKESDEINKEINDPPTKSTAENLNDSSIEEDTTNSRNSVKEAVPEQSIDISAVKTKECADSMEVETHSQVPEIKCDSSSDEKSSIKDAAMDVSESKPAELITTESQVSDPQITSLSEDLMKTESQSKQMEENCEPQQNGHVECDEGKPEKIEDIQAKDSSDTQPDTNDSKESSKTESLGISQGVERNGETPENAEIDLSITKEIKVSSTEKTEVNNEEKCQSNGTKHSEISQNGGCAMTETLVREWLADYAALSPAEVHTFAVTVHHNKEVIAAVYNVLEERHKYNTLIDPVCTALFGFYRSREEDLQRFTLFFLPTLIYVYLNAVAHSESKNCRGVETLLVGIYNLEVIDDKGQPREISFRLPSLAQASIYHEPMSLAPASLTESALRRLEECNSKLVRWGPLPQIDRILAQNRLPVMTSLLYIYNRSLSLLPNTALEYLCKVTSKLVTQGFSKANKRVSYGTEVPRVLPRIPVSSQLLQQLLHSVYYAMYNGYGYLAVQAVEDIHQRACYQCYTEVLLLTNSIKNSSHFIHSGSHSDAPMGISMAISPATATTTVSKSMITNASFRTKKLPDDIPIQMAKAEGDAAALGAISEEREDGAAPPKGETTPETTTRRSLPKMAVNFGKKTKEKLTIKSSSTANTKPLPLKTLVNGSGDISESEENGDLANELTPLSLSENGSEISTPVNLRKSSGSTIELEPTRSMQVSSV